MTITTAHGEGKFADVGNGIRIHYHEQGEGFPLIMLHGGGPGAAGLSNYGHNVEALSRRFRVIVPDMPGYGRSTKCFDIEDPLLTTARIMIAFMDAVGINKAHLVGNSLGGGVATTIAMEDPERVARLVLMGPIGSQALFTPMPTTGILQLITYYAGEGPTLEKLEAFVRTMVYDQSLVTQELLAERFRASIEPDTLANPPMRPSANPQRNVDLWRDPRLSSLAAPTLLMWGTADRVNPFDSAFLYLRTIPRVELHAVSQCGHWIQWERPQLFNEQTASFLTRDE